MKESVKAVTKYIFLFLLFPLSVSAQHTITGTFSPAKDFNFVIIYKIEPDKMVYAVNGKIENGKMALTLNDKFSPGMYRLVYELPEEENNFTFIYNGKEDVNFEFSNNNGVVFKNGQNKIFNDYLKDMERVRKEIGEALDIENPKEKMNALSKQQLEIQKNAESKADELTLKYIQALKPFIQDSFENKAAYNIYRKTNFFDHFDFKSEQLQASQLPLEQLKKYYHEFVTLEGGNNYRSVIDDLVREIWQTDKNYQKNLLSAFWQFLYDEKRTNAANYLASQHLIKLAKSQNDTVLASNLERIVNTSIGAKAPNFELKNYDSNKSFHDLNNAEFYLVVFWSTECSHCMTQIPEIYEEIKDIPTSKLQVVAVALEIDDTVWKQKSKEFKTFINVLALDDWRDNIVQLYDVQATPTFFVMDKNKEIISRPRGKNNLMTVVNAIKEYNPN